MERHGNMNVFKGPESMRSYFDPDFAPPLPLVEIPDRLNPLRKNGVRIYAKMMTALPCQNVKNLPALNMLLQAGLEAEGKTIVECSSGSTVISVAMCARVLHGNDNVHAFVSNKTERSRLRTLQFFGLKPQVPSPWALRVLQLTASSRHLYGGPGQPEILDPRGEIQRLKHWSQKSDGTWNPGQYENMDNPDSHVRWTGPQLMAQLPEINVFCSGMGSEGCITGVGKYLKEKKPAVTVVGICNKTADAIPGPRPSALFEKVEFPWKRVTNAVREVGSIEAYRLSMRLSREGLICGPSSGMALQGLLDFLEDEKAGGRLQSHADADTGDVSCVFLCCDLPYQYMDKYFEKLTAGAVFHSIENEELTAVDQGPYSPEWELTLEQATAMANVRQFTLTRDGDERNGYIAPSSSLVVDLRAASDFSNLHIYGSMSKPLDSLASDTESPFNQKSILCAQAKDIESIVEDLSDGNSVPILVVCYSRETSRLACSILRHRGIESYSLKGGFSASVPHENV
ncbi:unnamed protein product [Clonostachys rhizophaga]|uniref:Rhodanese domain-containing protein n=1 Tax=Clonostachys rhizophaga TaxID=160324 RepID=A0A9N9YLF8_9HYPO|nr:unnamed protein product [Clonostachys rhizophaga]